MSSSKIQTFCQKFDLAFSYFSGWEIKAVRKKKKTSQNLSNIHYVVIWKPKGVSVSESAEKIRETFIWEKVVLTEDILLLTKIITF